MLHGLASEEAEEPLATANTESNLRTFGLSHFLQTTRLEEEIDKVSNWAPQSLHLYSKIGIALSLMQYSECTPPFQCATGKSPGKSSVDLTIGAFFVAMAGVARRKSLDSRGVIA